MMTNLLPEETLRFIIARITDNFYDAAENGQKNRSDSFAQGRSLAYYEVLDIIKNELDAHEYELEEFGLNIDLESKL